jgi:hypothetical protein
MSLSSSCGQGLCSTCHDVLSIGIKVRLYYVTVERKALCATQDVLTSATKDEHKAAGQGSGTSPKNLSLLNTLQQQFRPLLPSAAGTASSAAWCYPRIPGS